MFSGTLSPSVVRDLTVQQLVSNKIAKNMTTSCNICSPISFLPFVFQSTLRYRPLCPGTGLGPASVLDRGLSSLSRTGPSCWRDSASEGEAPPRSKARSCSEKERSLFKGVGELSALRSSPLSGESSSWRVGGRMGRGWRCRGRGKQRCVLGLCEYSHEVKRHTQPSVAKRHVKE